MSCSCRLGIAVLAASLAAPGFAAETYPVRPIRWIIPFSPSGAADVPARVAAPKLSELLGQQIVVDNRPGGGGMLGAELVARATADGYTLMLSSNTHFVSSALRGKLPFHPLDDFTGISTFLSAPSVLVVHPSLPAKTLKELIGLAKASPGKIDFASSGVGSNQHLLMALLMRMGGFELTHVPYKGSAPATADLLGGQVKVGFPGIALVLPHLRSGRLRPLGLSSERRSPELPDVPTIAEAGVPGYSATQWLGLAGPKALPPAVVKRLFAAVHEVARNPDVVKAWRAAGGEVYLSESPAQYVAFTREEATKWARVVKDSGASIN